MTLMFLNGGAMRGGPLHDLLRGARFVGVVRTAPRYRFYSVEDRFPALAEVEAQLTGPQNELTGPRGEGARLRGSDKLTASQNELTGPPNKTSDAPGKITGLQSFDGGVSVVGELYDVPWEVLRESLLPAEPDELELGVIELEDGSGTLAMVRRRSYTELAEEYRDISAFADWRAYQAAVAARAAETAGAAEVTQGAEASQVAEAARAADGGVR